MGVLRVGRVVLMLVVAVGVMPPAALAAGWSVVPSAPLQVPAGSLSGVSCVSTSSCTAVGHYTNKAGDEVTLAERWDGTSWAAQTTPNPTGATGSELSGVSCVSASACTAVGHYTNKASEMTLVERWDGTSWAIQTTPNPTGASRHLLSGVSCVSASACTAVGRYTTNERDDVGGAVGRDELGDPDHPQHRSIQPAVWRVVRVGERVHRRWQLHRGGRELCGAVGRDELGDPDHPQP